jgi:hypothetical protein
MGCSHSSFVAARHRLLSDRRNPLSFSSGWLAGFRFLGPGSVFDRVPRTSPWPDSATAESDVEIESTVEAAIARDVLPMFAGYCHKFYVHEGFTSQFQFA